MRKTPPDLEAVRKAVASYFADDVESAAARAALSEWGESALPHLERLAREPHDPQFDHPLLCAITDVSAPRALELFVEILDGATAVQAESALTRVSVWATSVRVLEGNSVTRGLLPERVRESASPRAAAFVLEGGDALRRLDADPRFKRAMRRFGSSASINGRGVVADTAAALGWQDFVPLIRTMLEDEHLSLRTSAARALSVLTEERVLPRRPVASFPKRDIRPGFLAAPRVFERVSRGRADSGVVTLGKSGAPLGHVSLAKTDGPAAPTHAVCRDVRGEVAWCYQPPRARITSLAALWSDDEVYGVALGLGGETSIVALDASGANLWDVREKYILYALRSHRALPGVLLQVGGRVTVFDHDRTGARERDLAPYGVGSSGEGRVYAKDAQLFPAEDGGVAWIVTSASAEPSLVRYDARADRRFRAVLPGRPSRIAVVEPSDGERWFAVAADSGELFVLDARGTLVWEGALPGMPQDEDVSIRNVEAREVDGAWFVAVHTRFTSLAYEVLGTGG